MQRRSNLRLALALLLSVALLLLLAHGQAAPGVLPIVFLVIAFLLVTQHRIIFEQPARRSVLMIQPLPARAPPA